MNQMDAEKIIIITNMGKGSEDIKSDVPHDEDWEPLGDDYYLSPDGGVCGPSIGDPYRTYVTKENFPCCPICNDWVSPDDLYGCQCQIEEIKEYYGLCQFGEDES